MYSKNEQFIVRDSQCSFSFTDRIKKQKTKPAQSATLGHIIVNNVSDGVGTNNRSHFVAPLNDLIPGIRTNGLVSLDNFLQDPKEESYDPRSLNGRDWDIPFANLIRGALKEYAQLDPLQFDTLKCLFGESVIIDIGAGSSINGYIIANYLGAKGYVGIEPFRWRELTRAFLENTQQPNWYTSKTLLEEDLRDAVHSREPTFFNLAFEDALTFLKRIPNYGVSILSSGIVPEDNIICGEDYIRELKYEMWRVLGIGSTIILGGRSVVPREVYSMATKIFTWQGVSIYRK